MRMSVTLDPENERIVRSRAHARGISLSRALNELVEDAVKPAEQLPPLPRNAAGIVPSRGRPFTEEELNKFLEEEDF